MTLFDPKAELANIENQEDTPATSATFATQTHKTAPHVAEVADVAALRLQNQKTENPSIRAQETDTRYGASVGGRPRTWTGMIVSLDEWRRLGDRARRGSTGKEWNGLTRQWERRR